jgi:hypothetical protein
MVAQELGPTPGCARCKMPPQTPETRSPVRAGSRRESFSEPLSWAAKWCGFALFGPSGIEPQAGLDTGDR